MGFNRIFKKKEISPLINMFEMLKKAHNEHYAVAHININNLEWIKATLDAAQQTKTGVILGVSEGAVKYMCGFKNVTNMVVNTILNLHIIVGSISNCF